jgi:hypothetical protein
MMYKVVYPFESTIYGDSFKEALKHFIKLNNNVNITRMIIKDQSNQIDAKINYYKKDGHNKVRINMIPVGLQYHIPMVSNSNNVYHSMSPRSMSPSPMSSPRDNSPFIPIIKNPIDIYNLLPLSPMSLSDDNSPFVPIVINIPNY